MKNHVVKQYRRKVFFFFSHVSRRTIEIEIKDVVNHSVEMYGNTEYNFFLIRFSCSRLRKYLLLLP